MAEQPDSQVCVTVGLPEGLHMRPLSLLAQAAQSYAADIVLRKGEQSASAKEPLALMALGADCGEELWIEARGPDAEEAVNRLAALFSTNFAEECP